MSVEKIKSIKLVIDEADTQSFIVSQQSFNPRYTEFKTHHLLVETDKMNRIIPLYWFKSAGKRITKKKLEKLEAIVEFLNQNYIDHPLEDEDIADVSFGAFKDGQDIDQNRVPGFNRYGTFFNKLYFSINQILG